MIEFLVTIAENSNEFKKLFLNNENYLTAIWNLIGLFKNQIEILKSIIKLLYQIIDFDSSVRFSHKLLKHIKSLIVEDKKNLERNLVEFENIQDLQKLFSSRKKASYSRDNSDYESENEEDKERLRRVYEFVSTSPEKSVEIEYLEKESGRDINNNVENELRGNFLSKISNFPFLFLAQSYVFLFEPWLQFLIKR